MNNRIETWKAIRSLPVCCMNIVCSRAVQLVLITTYFVKQKESDDQEVPRFERMISESQLLAVESTTANGSATLEKAYICFILL